MSIVPEEGHRDTACSHTAAQLAHGYHPLPGVFDELLEPSGEVRPHWRPFIEALETLGPSEIERRFSAADRHLRESGVYHRVYHDPVNAQRDWPLSHVPLILGAEEWAGLESGLIERAEVMERILADVYGPADLIANGLLPAAVIAGNPEFLRPAVGTVPRSEKHLHLYAADIGRGPDGRWWVLSDRTQAPSGAGYALENRIALSRALPDVFRSLNINRLAGFFQSFRETLATYNRTDDARICLLSPGPLNETYFEHAYLARYLGLLLVEGEDLTVRGDEVFVRTVSGLKRADVIWRRLDSDFIDPLELNAKSRLGVPGLLRAVRSQSLMLANGIGTGLAESRSLMSFVPRLATHLMGTAPTLPNVATWWCGQDAEREHVLANFESMIIAPAYAVIQPGILGGGARVVAELTPAERDELRAAILQRGQDFVGQEVVKLSTMPVWHNGKLEPHPFVLRLFVARTTEGWKVMPGGFCRVSESADARAISMQVGGRSADVWVTAHGPVEQKSLIPARENVAVRRLPGSLPSRAADNLFWLGRYLERAEATLRVLRAMLSRADEASDEARADEQALFDLLDLWGAIDDKTPDSSPGLIASAALHGTRLPNALPGLLMAARGAASVIRDRFSPDAWRALNDAVAVVDQPERTKTEAEAFYRVNQTLQIIAAFSGLAQENMNRLNGWRFLEIGRRLERALATCRVARQFAGDEPGVSALDTLLELGDCQITYRLRYTTMAARGPVLDLIMLDVHNPRSVAFQIEQIEKHLGGLPSSSTDGLPSASDRIAIALSAELHTTLAQDLTEASILAIEAKLLRLSDEIALRFFTHRDSPVGMGEDF